MASGYIFAILPFREKNILETGLVFGIFYPFHGFVAGLAIWRIFVIHLT